MSIRVCGVSSLGNLELGGELEVGELRVWGVDLILGEPDFGGSGVWGNSSLGVHCEFGESRVWEEKLTFLAVQI